MDFDFGQLIVTDPRHMHQLIRADAAPFDKPFDLDPIDLLIGPNRLNQQMPSVLFPCLILDFDTVQIPKKREGVILLHKRHAFVLEQKFRAEESPIEILHRAMVLLIDGLDVLNHAKDRDLALDLEESDHVVAELVKGFTSTKWI